jgi:hypothetical protein
VRAYKKRGSKDGIHNELQPPQLRESLWSPWLQRQTVKDICDVMEDGAG